MYSDNTIGKTLQLRISGKRRLLTKICTVAFSFESEYYMSVVLIVLKSIFSDKFLLLLIPGLSLEIAVVIMLVLCLDFT